MDEPTPFDHPQSRFEPPPNAPNLKPRLNGRRPTIEIPPTGLLTVTTAPIRTLPLGPKLAWFHELIGGLVQGGVYLFSGAPGGGKSRLATQVALAAATQEIRSLSVLTEERQDRLLARATMLTSDWSPLQAERAIRQMESTVNVSRLSDLPFVVHLGPHPLPSQQFKLLIIDSLQGDGLPANAAREYGAFFEFCRRARAEGVTVIAIGHVNKRGQIAGPRGLEHAVDGVVRIEKAGTGRLIAITKNRFAAEKPAGLPLITDPRTSALVPSPHRAPMTGIARTFIGSELGDAELQVQLSLPMPGERPQISAPGLPRRRIEQLVRSISATRGLDLDEINLNISSLLPGDTRYRAWLDLPLAMSLVASLLRRPVPALHIYVGEIDLNRALRPLPRALTDAIAEAVVRQAVSPSTRLFLPTATAAQLDGLGCQLVPCATFDQVLALTWPEAIKEVRDVR
jgi:DNA repair protein RadA/Sms